MKEWIKKHAKQLVTMALWGAAMFWLAKHPEQRGELTDLGSTLFLLLGLQLPPLSLKGGADAVKGLAGGAVIVCALALGVATPTVACNASSQQLQTTLQDGLDLGTCVVSKVLGGLTDPASLMSCAGATEKLVLDVIDDFKAQHAPAQVAADAGPVLAADGIVKPSLSPSEERLLDIARTQMAARLAMKASSK